MNSLRSYLPLILLMVLALTRATGCSDDPANVERTQALPTNPWVKTIGSVGYDKSHDIAADPTGNVFVTGAFSDAVDFGDQTLDPSNGPVFIAKYSPSGEFLWVKQLKGVSPDGFIHLGTDNSGGVVLHGDFIIAAVIDGTTIASAGGAEHVLVARFDPAGNLVWVEHDTGSYMSVGFGMDTGESGGTAVAGFINVGATFGETELTAQPFDLFVVNYDAAGHPLWAWQSGSSTTDLGGEVAVDPFNNVIVAGAFTDSLILGDIELRTNTRDAFLAKFSVAGDLLWATPIGDENPDVAYGITTDGQGDVYVNGYRSGMSGVLWKYTSGGDFVWQADIVSASDIAVDPSHNTLLSGSYQGALSVGDSEVTSNGSNDFFIAKYDRSGQGLWVVSGGGPGGEQARGIAVDGRGAPIAVVDFSDSFEFAGETVTSIGDQDLLILKLE
jgi:hypothetical protein